jgi:hypothetical protein
VSTSFTKQRAEASSTALFTEKLPEIIKEMGLLESRSRLKEYVSMIIIGNCYVYGNNTKKVFRLPKEKNELYNYLEQDNSGKELVVDLSTVATCLYTTGSRWMYTHQKKH